MQFTIRLIDGKLLEFKNDSNQCTIGRSSKCDLVIVDEAMSRQHCQVELEDEVYYVTDMGSTNGVFIDGERIPVHKKVSYSTFRNLAFGAVESLEIKDHKTISQLNPLQAPPHANTNTGNPLGKKAMAAKDVKIPVRKVKSKNQFYITNAFILILFGALCYWYFSTHDTNISKPRVPKERIDEIEEFNQF